MRLIAHRGNVYGPNPLMENRIDYLNRALDSGFDVEVDVQLIDGKLYLGHDSPQEEVSEDFLKGTRVWVHSKTSETFKKLSKIPEIHTFFQSQDSVSLTSKGYFWNHSSNTKLTDRKDILVNLSNSADLVDNRIYAICSDYVNSFKYPNSNNHKCPFKLLILDVDGVMTAGNKDYGLSGEVICKRYADIDFTAIKRFRSNGVEVCFLSGDDKVNKEMAKIRKVPFYFSKGIPKATFIPKLCEDFDVTVDEMAYLGDDYYDLDIMQYLNYQYCPANSAKCVKDRSIVLSASGGAGAVEELYSMFFED
jgi:3-deoxy-D-manno-octulosonate 8-phosphate phosphatase (KDO 8-P phosphatase)